MSSYFVNNNDISSVIVGFLGSTDIKKRFDDNESEEDLEITQVQIKIFDKVHDYFQRACALNPVSMIDKYFSNLVSEQLSDIKYKIARNIYDIYIGQNGADCFSSCVESGYYLSVLKVYYTFKPYLLQNEPANKDEEFGKTILHSALSATAMSPLFIDFVLNMNQDYFISKKRDVNLLDIKDVNEDVPLRLLCKSTATVKAIDEAFKILFSFPTAKDHINSLNSSLTYNPLDLTNSENMPPFYYLRNSENIQVLLDNGADINVQNENGNTVLHIWSKQNKFKIIKVLLEKGANPNLRNTENKTPLDLAFSCYAKKKDLKSIDTIKCLLNNGAHVTENIRKKYPSFFE